MNVLTRVSRWLESPVFGAAAFGAGLVLASLLISVLSGRYGKIGPDGDDVMRLVQIKDLLGGQGWFDLTQYRLGADGGTVMHWSRLIDLPIILLTFLLTPFIGQSAALEAAISIWPALTLTLPAAGFILAARAYGGKYTLPFVFGIGAMVLLTHFRFRAGAIDHHNVQLGLILLTLALIADPQRRTSRFAIAGLAAALAVAVGVEVWIFAAALAIAVAIDWAVTGEAARRGARAFGASFAAGLFVFLAATVRPSAYGQIACDVLSGPVALTGAMGGLGLMLCAQFMSGRNRHSRILALGVLAGAALVTARLIAPQCLQNPLDSLSPLMQSVWLPSVQEARPVQATFSEGWEDFLFRYGTILPALLICCLLIRRPASARFALLFGGMIALTLAFSLLQVRFFVFVQLLSVVPMGIAAAHLLEHASRDRYARIQAILMTAAALPMMWALAGTVLDAAIRKPSPQGVVTAHVTSDDEALIAALNRLPRGRVLASANLGPDILNRTKHSVLYGNYHRNTLGIEATLQTLLSPSAEAEARLQTAGVDYVVFRPNDPEARQLAAASPDGFIAQLIKGTRFEWLKDAAPIQGEAGSIIFRVEAPSSQHAPDS